MAAATVSIVGNIFIYLGLILTVGNRNGFSKATCSAAMLTDDVMNGNVTNGGGSYFMGLNQVPILLEELRTNLSSIDGNLSQLYNTAPTTVMNQAIS